MEDDSELLRRFVEDGSESSFGLLVQRHVDLVFAAALRQVHDAHLAEDIVQTVFIDLARKARSLWRRPILVSWLYKSTRFAASKALRANHRRRARETEALIMNELLSPDPDPDWNRLRPILDEVICQLGERDREAVLLRFYKGMPFAAIAAALQTTEEVARQRVGRALDKMYALLARRGITSTTAAIAAVLASRGAVAAPAGLALKAASGAVAASIAGGGAIGGLLNLMTTTKSITAAATLAALVAIGTAVYEAGVAREGSRALANSNAERSALQKRLDEGNRKLGTVGDGQESRKIEVGGPRDGAAAQGKRGSSPFSPEVEKVLSRPELRKLYLQRVVLRTKEEYGRFFASAGLTPSQQDAFANLFAARENGNLDLFESLRSQNMLTPAGMSQAAAEGTQALINQEAGKIAADFSEGMNDLLGPKLNAECQQFSAGLGARGTVDQLTAQLAATDSPLSPQQADQLAQVIAQQGLDPAAIGSAQAGTAAAVTAALAGSLAGISLDSSDVGVIAQEMEQPGNRALVTDAAVVRAQDILNPKQLAILQNLQLQQAIQIKLAPQPARR